MKKSKTIFNNVHIFTPDIFKDDRGFFFESYNASDFNKLLGTNISFVQDYHSFTKKYVVRGMHFQNKPYQQDKLVRVVSGEIYDVVVDIRRDSDTYGRWHGEILSSSNNFHIWIPKGFAHGFITLSETSIFHYKLDEYYHPESEGSISAYDPDLGIDWKIPEDEWIQSEKDKKHPTLLKASVFDFKDDLYA